MGQRPVTARASARAVSDGRVTRRQLLRWGAGGLLGALGAGVVSGCGMPASAARLSAQSPIRAATASLTFWTWLPVQPVVSQSKKQRPDIQVSLQVIPAGSQGGYQKMYSALRAGNAPDLAHVEYQEIPSFMLVQGLTDLRPYGVEHYRRTTSTGSGSRASSATGCSWSRGHLARWRCSTGRIFSGSWASRRPPRGRSSRRRRGECASWRPACIFIPSRPATPRGSRGSPGRPAANGSSLTVTRGSSTSTTRRPVTWRRSGAGSSGTILSSLRTTAPALGTSRSRTARWPATSAPTGMTRSSRTTRPAPLASGGPRECRSGRRGRGRRPTGVARRSPCFRAAGTPPRRWSSPTGFRPMPAR